MNSVYPPIDAEEYSLPCDFYEVKTDESPKISTNWASRYDRDYDGSQRHTLVQVTTYSQRELQKSKEACKRACLSCISKLNRSFGRFKRIIGINTWFPF